MCLNLGADAIQNHSFEFGLTSAEKLSCCMMLCWRNSLFFEGTFGNQPISVEVHLSVWGGGDWGSGEKMLESKGDVTDGVPWMWFTKHENAKSR